MTVLEIVLLIAGKMPVFDAVATSFGTAGTGGFGIKNDSMASYSPYIQWVVTVFMILFGVNFNAYYFLVFRYFKKAFSMEEVRYYFLIIAASKAIIFFEIDDTMSSAGRSIKTCSISGWLDNSQRPGLQVLTLTSGHSLGEQCSVCLCLRCMCRKYRRWNKVSRFVSYWLRLIIKNLIHIFIQRVLRKLR